MNWFRRSAKQKDEKTAPERAEAKAEVAEAITEAPKNPLLAQLEAIDPGLDPFGFQQLCERIGDAREAATVPLLIDLLGRRARHGLAPTNRKAAVQALGQIGDPAAVDILIDELALSPYYAAAALGACGDRRAAEPLISVLQHDDWLVRSAAAEALGKLGDPTAGDALRGLANDDRAEVRRAAETALAKLGDSEIGWYLDTTDTKQVGDHLVGLGILDRATVARMFSLGTYRLLAPAGADEESPGTVILANTQFGDGVCGDPFLVDRIVLNLGTAGQRAVAEITCPKCGAVFELQGMTLAGGESQLETWLVTSLTSIPDRFAQSPYLGWPQIDHTTVEVEPGAEPTVEAIDWEVVEAGTERRELIDAGELGADNIAQFNVYQVKAPAGTMLQAGDAIAVSGVEVCGVCQYEIPLDVSIGLGGFLDCPSKRIVVCPRCNSSALVAGATTTSRSGVSRYWLLATQETGTPGIGVDPSGGRPELRISNVARAVVG